MRPAELLTRSRQSDAAPARGASPAWATGAALLGFAVLALSQVSLALVDDRATEEWLASVVVVSFAVTVALVIGARWGASRAAGAVAVVTTLTLAVEWAGHSTGYPFGEYDYTGALAPTLAGVPVIVPLAWFAMGVAALEVGHHIARSRVGAVAIGALALTAWDLFLDPQMVDAGYWQWATQGSYHGIPWTNYVGWLATGAVVLGLVERLRPPTPPPSTGLLALYSWWAVSYAFAFVVFFGAPGVAVVGGAAMGAISLLAWTARAARRRVVT